MLIAAQSVSMFLLLLVSLAACTSGDDVGSTGVSASWQDETSLLQTFASVKEHARNHPVLASSGKQVVSSDLDTFRGTIDQHVPSSDGVLVSVLSKISTIVNPSAHLNVRFNSSSLDDNEDLPLIDPILPVDVGLNSGTSKAEKITLEKTRSSHERHEPASHQSKVPRRSNFQVLIVCVVVISAVIAGWCWWCFVSTFTTDVGGVPVTGAPSGSKLCLLCASFACCSWGMNVVNKTLIHALKAPSLVTGAQMIMTVVATLLCGFRKINGTKRQVLCWSFIPLIYFGMLVSSFFTFQYLTLSMLMVIRNMGPLITLPIEVKVMPADKVPVITGPMVLSLLFVLASTLVYCHGVETSAQGLAFSMLNMVLAITDRVAQRRLLSVECGEEVVDGKVVQAALSTETCVLLNNTFGLIPTIILSLCLGEFAQADVHEWFCSINTFLLLLSGVIGAGICYFALAVQREISATSFMVLQNAVRMAVVVVGVVVFFDPISWPWQVTGLTMSFAGAFWYGCIQSNNKPPSGQKDQEKNKSGAIGSPSTPLEVKKNLGS